jgi:riboflavin kinase/FMN adenylyltransferase
MSGASEHPAGFRVFRGPDGVASAVGPNVMAFDKFDGMHRGHQVLLARAADASERLGLSHGAVTFDRHPDASLRPGAVPPVLTSLGEKLRLLCEAGAQFVVLLAADASVLGIPVEQFVRDVLRTKMSVRVVVVRENFRFGNRGGDSALTLRQLSSVEGLECVEVATVEVAGGPVSATRIRASLADGDVELARKLLGRPYDVPGVIRFLEPSLASLVVPAARVVPKSGKYAGSFRLHTRSRAVNAIVEVIPLGDTAHGLTVHCSDRALAGEHQSGLGRVAFNRRLTHAWGA